MAMDPIVIDPPDFDQASAWAECNKWVEDCGGLSGCGGEPNWKAAFGADPGVCSCPACGEYYWCWGRMQRCIKCSFEYPTDAWPKYSAGVNARRRFDSPPPALSSPDIMNRFRARHARDMKHPYYRYGFEHPPDSAFDEFKRIDWKSVLPTPQGAHDER